MNERGKIIDWIDNVFGAFGGAGSLVYKENVTTKPQRGGTYTATITEMDINIEMLNVDLDFFSPDVYAKWKAEIKKMLESDRVMVTAEKSQLIHEANKDELKRLRIEIKIFIKR